MSQKENVANPSPKAPRVSIKKLEVKRETVKVLTPAEQKQCPGRCRAYQGVDGNCSEPAPFQGAGELQSPLAAI